MGSSVARLLDVLSLLQARPRWSAPELADRLGITERTVRRDMARLRELGYPVEAEPGPTGGYQLGAGRALPPLLLTDDEAVAVALGLRVAAGGAVGGLEEAAVAAAAKLEQVLPARLRDRVLALTATTVVVHRGGVPTVEPEVLLTVAQGCRRNERVRFAYVDGAGRFTERRVEPYGLVNAERRWYLVAHDVERNDWRTFRLDRITEAALTGHRFERTSEPDTAAMVVDAIAHTAYRWQATILLHTTADEAAAEILPSIGSVEADGGGVRLRLGANDLGWIARYLAGLPFAFDIVDPPELRAAVRAHALQLAAANRRQRPPATS